MGISQTIRDCKTYCFTPQCIDDWAWKCEPLECDFMNLNLLQSLVAPQLKTAAVSKTDSSAAEPHLYYLYTDACALFEDRNMT